MVMSEKKWSITQIEKISMGAAATRGEMTSIIRQLLAELTLANDQIERLQRDCFENWARASKKNHEDNQLNAIEKKYGI